MLQARQAHAFIERLCQQLRHKYLQEARRVAATAPHTECTTSLL